MSNALGLVLQMVVSYHVGARIKSGSWEGIDDLNCWNSPTLPTIPKIIPVKELIKKAERGTQKAGVSL